MINIIYSRVSKKDETIQDIRQHELKVMEKFNLNDAILLNKDERIEEMLSRNAPIILRDRGSAYNMDKLKERTEFLKLLKFCFNFHIMDLWLQKFKKKDVRIYVWDSHRIMRNFFYSMLFLLQCDLFGIEIYTHKDGKLKKDEKETPVDIFVRYLRFSAHAFSGMEYSHTISTNVKKSVKIVDGISIGTKQDADGRKWGRQFTNIHGNIVQMTPRKINNMNKSIYESIRLGSKYDTIIDEIKQVYRIKISKSYISKVKYTHEVQNGKKTKQQFH